MSELDEIRVNSYYATQVIAEYPDGPTDKNPISKPVVNKRTMRTDELFNKLKKISTFSTVEYKMDHLFPPNCRYYEKHQDGFLVVIEEDPAYRTICIDKDMGNELASLKSSGKLKEYGYEKWEEENPHRPYTFNLALPYAVFFLAFNNKYESLGGRIFFRTKPISGFSDVLCKAPFLNISDSQNICFGDRIYKGPRRSLFADVNHAVSVFWSTIFNPDYIYNYVAYQDVPGLCDYLTWQYYSQTNPMFIYTADWVKEPDTSVGNTIEQLRSWIQRSSERRGERNFTFGSLNHLFSSQYEGDLEKVPGIDVKEPLIYDVAQYIYLDDTMSICVGDSFKDKNGKYLFIDSFLGFRKMIEPAYALIQNEAGNRFKIRLKNKTRKFLADKIKEERHVSQVELPNGQILKAGDILVMKNSYGNNIYRKIYYLRKTVDGRIEGRFGSYYYMLDDIPENTSVLDMKHPKYLDMHLKIKNTYVVVRTDHYNSAPYLPIAFSTFNEITTGRNQNLILKFTENEGSNKGYQYNINMSGTDRLRRVYDPETLGVLPDIFRQGRKLMYARDGRASNNVGKAYILPNVGIGVTYNVSIKEIGRTQHIEKLIDGEKFKVESWDSNIEFSIGDKVVVANWDDPIDMLTVKQIQGFVENKENGDVVFALTDKNGKLYEYKYIDGARHSINVGSVRKITNKIGDLSAGMKITAHTAGIQMFPKKDTNIIIGMLTDTGGEPLVLCSNACTLWYSDVIELFDIIPMGTDQWKSKKHAPITPSKMRIQAGDLLNGKGRYKCYSGYIAYRPRESRTIRALHLDYYNSYEESFVFDRSFTNDVVFTGFPNPRLSVKQEDDLGFVHAFPNFHGMYTQTTEYYSPYLFPNDKRSILNVSDSSE